MGCQVSVSTPVKGNLPISNLYGTLVGGKFSLLLKLGDLLGIWCGCPLVSHLPNASMPPDEYPALAWIRPGNDGEEIGAQSVESFPSTYLVMHSRRDTEAFLMASARHSSAEAFSSLIQCWCHYFLTSSLYVNYRQHFPLKRWLHSILLSVPWTGDQNWRADGEAICNSLHISKLQLVCWLVPSFFFHQILFLLFPTGYDLQPYHRDINVVTGQDKSMWVWNCLGDRFMPSFLGQPLYSQTGKQKNAL